MIDEHAKRMIRGYLPHRRDESLGFDEYFWEDYSGKIQKVVIQDIFPYEDGTEFGLRYAGTGKRVHTSDDPFHGVQMSQLYDNRIDCKDRTHICYSGWEHLRIMADKNGWDEYTD